MTLQMRYSRFVTILAIAVCMATSTNHRAYAQSKTGSDAFNGTWNLDITKSDFGNTAPPKNVTMTLAGTPTSRKWTTKAVGADGKSQTMSYNGAADGRYYRIAGSPEGATFAYMKDGSSFAIKDKSGKVVQTTTYALSADGRTMMLHNTFHTPDGDETHVVVFQKER